MSGFDLQKRPKTQKEKEKEIQAEVWKMSALTFQDISGNIFKDNKILNIENLL